MRGAEGVDCCGDNGVEDGGDGRGADQTAGDDEAAGAGRLGGELFTHGVRAVSVMAALSEASQRELRRSALAAFAEGSLSRLSQVVARLERKGHVRRHPDPADGRYTLATLTDEGYRKTVSAAPGHVELVRRLTAPTGRRAGSH